MARRVLYFSPHLDDVVLSCAGRIATEVAAGDEVRVVTLFTDGDASSIANYRTRRAEDEAALLMLGASPLHLGLLDAPFRDPFYSSFSRIVFGAAPSDTDASEKIQEAVCHIWKDFNPDCVLFPLAVGTHIDHRLCHQAALCLPENATIEYYEDRPYALVSHATELRLAQLGRCVIDPDSGLPQDFKAEHLDTLTRGFRQVNYVNRYASGPGEIEEAIQRMQRPECFAGKAERLSARPTLRIFDTPVRNKILSAVSCYQTQLSDLFGDMNGFSLATDDYSRLIGSKTYAERYWSL